MEVKGFKTAQLPVTVLTGNVSSGNLTLEIGSSSTVIEVAATAIAINSEQATIQGVVTENQIQNLPINGRNFSTWRSWSLASRFRTAGTLIQRRRGSLPFPSVAGMAVLHVSKWMDWTSRMKPLEPRP